MKILLIEPNKSTTTIGGEDFFIYEPLALEYIATGVAEEHYVKIVDLRIDKNLQEVFNKFKPDIVGITSYTVHVNMVKYLFDTIKRWNKEVLTVVGGHHATIAPEEFNYPSIDLIVIGEGVKPFKEVVERFNKKKCFTGISGLAFKKNGKLIINDPVKSIDLDSLPLPRRDLTSQYRNQYFSEWMRPLASIRTSKGCPYRCNFCALWKISHGKYFTRKPEKIVEELSTISEKYIFFADDESLIDTKRMMSLAELIKRKAIDKRYFIYGRSDTISKNAELLKNWKGIGLERVFVGLEFFRNEDLMSVRKNSTVKDNANAVKILKDLDIDIYASFIIKPEFSVEDFKLLRRYIRSLKLDFASVAVLTPLPGTDLFEQMSNRLIIRNYDYYDFIHTILPTKLSYKEFYHEYKHLIRTAIPIWRVISLLAKFPMKDMLPVLKKSIELQKRIRDTYYDYCN